MLATDTEISDPYLTVKGSGHIVKVSQAQETVPLAYAALLPRDSLLRVKQITFNKMRVENTTDVIQQTYMMHVDSLW